MRVAFYTQGCKVNQYETQCIREQLLSAGYQIADRGNHADIYVFNTCTVTADSNRKARQLIRSIYRRNPAAKIVVTGCYAQHAKTELLSLPGVCLVVGNKEKKYIADLITKIVADGNTKVQPECIVSDVNQSKVYEEFGISYFANHSRAFVKVQDGCDNECSYCIVPMVRGKPRSRLLSEIKKEVIRLTKAGYKEIVLTGIRLDLYGKDLCSENGKEINLVTLIKEIANIEEVRRIRLSSLEPGEAINKEFIKTFAQEKKICPHLHIPLQSGSDRILARMNRKYTVEQYQQIIESIRKIRPETAFTTDIIVGFPGETETDFLATLQLVERIKFSKVHVFRYSPRPGTVAEKFTEVVDPKVVKNRANKLIGLANQLAMEYRKQLVGIVVEVLVEEKQTSTESGEELWLGLTSDYQRVKFNIPNSFASNDKFDKLIGDIIPVKVTGIDSDGHLTGVMV